MSRGELWTIDALGARVAAALAHDYQEPENGQVRAVPDRRTIRYYTTLGLIDRPAQMHGRTALYSRRHLEQLVAIKRLQAAGLSLAEVQSRLAGLPPTALARLARIPSAPEPANADADVAALAAPRATEFWMESPADPVAADERDTDASSPAGEAEVEGRTFSQPDQRAGQASAGALTGLPLGGGLVLLIPALRMPEARDLEVARRLALPLVEALTTLGLIAPGSDT